MSHADTLRHRIDAASDSYYNKGVSIVTDDEFDTMLAMLQRLDHKDPRLSRVGFVPSLEKVEHEFPMGSLDNIDANKPAELESYLKRNRGHVLQDSLYHITPKIDGSSLAFTYKAGKLVRVVTRGNGAVGQDITAKARFFKNVPTDLGQPIDITVRGEAVMHRDDFLAYIKSAELEGVRNPRNIGNGIIVRKDAFGAGLIHFYSFDCLSKTVTFKSVTEMYEFLNKAGFTAPDYQVVAEDGIAPQIDTMVQRDYPYDIDGLVIKVDSFEQQAIINEGCDELRLRSNQAVKFNSKKAETTVTGVTVTVGSTGKITPTLMVEPVEIGGIVNSNVLTYNYDEIERLRVGIGDKVQVVLAGDIIPKCLKIVDKHSTEIIQRPTGCPVCNNALSHKDLIRGKSVDLYCTNYECPGIQFEKIKGFIGSSKRGMGILGIGENLIRSLIKSGLVSTISDLYKLTEDQLRVLSMGNGVVGAKRAKTIIANIQESKNASIQKLIGSLGIDGMGEHRAEIMMEVARTGPLNDLRQLETFDDWIACAKGCNLIQLLKHPHLPQNVLISIEQQLHSMKDELLKLREMGVGVHEPKTEIEEVSEGSKPFAGLSFCFTGTRLYTDIVEKLGGEVKSGVSKKLDFLVQRDLSEKTSKAKKAAAYGITVLGVKELEAKIREADPEILDGESAFEEVFTMMDE